MSYRRAAALLVFVAGLSSAEPVAAQGGNTADELPTVRLEPPGFGGAGRDARRPTVRVLVEVRDCNTRPTVTITGTWFRRSGRAVLEVSGVRRVLRLSPQPAARRTDRFRFRRVRARRGRARIRGRFVTAWLAPDGGTTQCEIRLPRLIGLGASASAAERGIVQLRTSLPVEPPRAIPQRGTSRDHVWVCGGGRLAGFDCGLAVTMAAPAAEARDKETEECPENGNESECRTEDDGGDAPDWATALLIALGAASVGAVGVAATRRSTEGANVAETWDGLARKEYEKPDEPIAARASDLSKIGAPIATSVTAILAVIGGWVAEAPPGHTVIAVGAVVAVAVGGLLYVFAADFKSRAAVAVARFESLATHAQAEAKGNEKVTEDAQAKIEKAEAVSDAKSKSADAAKRDAEAAAAKADKARETADAKAAEATERIREADDKVTKLAAELTDTRDQLRRCTEQAKPASTGPSAPPSYLTLGGIDAVVGGAPAKVYAVESAGGNIIRYLVREADGRLRWALEAEVTDPPEPPA